MHCNFVVVKFFFINMQLIISGASAGAVYCYVSLKREAWFKVGLLHSDQDSFWSSCEWMLDEYFSLLWVEVDCCRTFACQRCIRLIYCLDIYLSVISFESVSFLRSNDYLWLTLACGGLSFSQVRRKQMA